jgi:tartrate dehydrogenase/decarboxylase/D-malate dehydrogenase
MTEYKIAMYPGDGIGVDVTEEVSKVLKVLSSKFDYNLKLTEYDWGHPYWKKHGIVAPENFLDELTKHDAVFLGAVGDPENVPDHISLKPLIQMRQQFDQYACVRPAKLLAGISTPLKNRTCADIDMVIVRENSEGEYVDAGGGFSTWSKRGCAVQTAIHTREGIERILRYGFELAAERKKHLTMATKSNALKYSMLLWDEVFEVVRNDYPEIESDKCHVDALAMNFVCKPDAYDVIVASNLFGDILSDLGAAISGSLGLAPSANINPERNFPSLFEPVHGSAPDIAGKGIANPVAAIRSAAMMLDFLGEKDSAAYLDEAINQVLADSSAPHTPDTGGSASTTEVGDAIISKLKNILQDI